MIAKNISVSESSDPAAFIETMLMAQNGTVFLATLASQAPAGSQMAISVSKVSAITADVINKTPTMKPSVMPSALPEMASDKADKTSVDIMIIIIIVLVVVGVLGVLVFVGIRFQIKRKALVRVITVGGYLSSHENDIDDVIAPNSAGEKT